MEVAKLTVTGDAENPLSVTVKMKSVFPPVPSAWITSSIVRVGAVSSSCTVPRPCGSRITPFDEAAERLTKNVSSISSVTSPLTSTGNVLDVSPGAKVSPVAPTAT